MWKIQQQHFDHQPRRDILIHLPQRPPAGIGRRLRLIDIDVSGQCLNLCHAIDVDQLSGAAAGGEQHVAPPRAPEIDRFAGTLALLGEFVGIRKTRHAIAFQQRLEIIQIFRARFQRGVIDGGVHGPAQASAG